MKISSKNMPNQVVILAAGASSRFFPFNNQDKSLFTICGKPIISYTLENVKKAGFTRAIIVTSDDHQQQIIESFKPEDLELTFTTLEDASGAGDAILTAKDLITDNFFVINSQQFKFHEQILPFTDKFNNPDFVGASLRMQTDTPEKYGIFKLDGDKVLELVEQPVKGTEPSNWKLVGTYFFKPEFLETLSNTPKGQYSLEAAINTLISTGQFRAFESSVNYSSLKYPWDLFEIKDQILNNLSPHTSEEAHIAQTAIIRGDVTIESGATVGDFAIIEGPAYIGKNAMVGTYSQIRAGSVLEEGAQAQRYCDVRGSIIGKNAHIHSQLVGDSILGEDVRIGAGFITGNKRMDRQNIHVFVKDKLVNAGRNNIGSFIGSGTNIGVGVSTMPGTVIGPKSVVYPGIVIKGTHPENSKITSSNL